MFENISLESARQAANQLNDLKTKAAMLPALEREQAEKESLSHLETLRLQTVEKLEALSNSYQQAISDYKTAFDALFAQLEKTSRLLKRVKQIENEIERTRSGYIGRYVRHNLAFRGDGSKSDQLKNGVTYEMAASDSLPRVRTNLQLYPSFSFAESLYHLLLKFKK